MKIYTKTGDKGQTGLIAGRRVWKDDLRIETYGTVDELASCLGVISGFLALFKVSSEVKKTLGEFLKKIQNKLFDLGCELAAPLPEKRKKLPRIVENDVRDLEKLIDRLEKELPPLRQFILPGGHALSGLLHLARSVCRRAERRAVQLSKKEWVSPAAMIYLNRLSDTLFVLARWAQKKTGSKEIRWKRSGLRKGSKI